MPAGKRTDRISRRDIEVLEFIARFGVVPRSAVALWAGTARTATIVRERRLREAGLIEVRCGAWGEGKLMACTRVGLRVAGRGDLRPARFRLETVDHESSVAELAARWERGGVQTMSEREILARERAEGRRVLSSCSLQRPFPSRRPDPPRRRRRDPGGDRGRAHRQGRGAPR